MNACQMTHMAAKIRVISRRSLATVNPHDIWMIMCRAMSQSDIISQAHSTRRGIEVEEVVRWHPSANRTTPIAPALRSILHQARPPALSMIPVPSHNCQSRHNISGDLKKPTSCDAVSRTPEHPGEPLSAPPRNWSAMLACALILL